MAVPLLRLKPGKERPILHGHPWVFSGALAEVPADLDPGGIVDLVDYQGTFLARAYANPRCSIVARILTRQSEAIDRAFVDQRVGQALALRRSLLPPRTDAFRVINGEGDGLPGVIVDAYADVVVLQCITAGAEHLRADVIASLAAQLQPRAIFERSAGSARREEGLGDRAEVVYGKLAEAPVIIRENGLRFGVDVRGGQKTGFFLDQRDNRAWTRHLAHGRTVLNAFGYTGAFSVYAAAGGARHVVTVDSSTAALAQAQANWELNDAPGTTAEWLDSDVFQYLRHTEESFDLLVLDPPALVKRRGDVDRGARAYKDLNLWGLRRAAPGALLLTFSCSQHVDDELFAKIVRAAAADAGRRVQQLGRLGSGTDHPTLLTHPEGQYLSGLLLSVAGPD